MTKRRKVSRPKKVEEPAAACGKPPLLVPKKASPRGAKSNGQTIYDAEFQRLAGKIFTEQKELLRKLAQ